MNDKLIGEPGHPLWDLPTRFFHWAMVICLPLSWWSAEQENYELHEYSGYTVLVLVVSRIIWGFAGSRHSRFNDFLAGPVRILRYVRYGENDSAGHNPLGGWSVLVLLSLLLLQATSGLFNTDDILFTGPFYYAAASEVVDTMGVIHELAFDGLLLMVSLHILVVIYHQYKRRENLIPAMVKGRALGREGLTASVPWWRFLLILGIVTAALWFGLEQAPQPEPLW